MVSAVDDGVGRVLEALKEQNLDEDTIILFLSDNGGARNNASDNGPLRGSKGDLFEGGIRVPFAIRWKGVLPEGNSYKKPVSSLDIMATIVARTDVKINKERPLDGVDLIPYLTGEKKGAPHDYLFWRKWKKNAMAVRHENFKLVSNKNQKKRAPELFDLSSDLGEILHLKSEESKITEDLQKKWNQWNRGLKDQVFPSLGEDIWWTKKN
jgi:arylsulfatase A-like enzyme